MSAVATAWAKSVAHINVSLQPSDKRALHELAKAHSIEKGCACRSYKALADATSDSVRTVKRAIDRLSRFGLVEKARQRKGQRQGANAYYLNLNGLRVSPCHPEKPFSGCHHETPEVVSPCHPEKSPQGVTMTPPNARARAVKGASSGFRIVVGGRDA